MSCEQVAGVGVRDRPRRQIPQQTQCVGSVPPMYQKRYNGFIIKLELISES